MNRRTLLGALAALSLAPASALAKPRDHALRHGFVFALKHGDKTIGFFKQGELGPKKHKVTLKRGYILDRARVAWIHGDEDQPLAVRIVHLEDRERFAKADDAKVEGFQQAPDLQNVPDGADRVAKVTLTSRQGFETGPIGIEPNPTP